ncbi:MAG TPA: homogentisate 1,2-dioxygenase, partial [Gemmataceae bacterium]|nr:homogentisate 1,2-dioxygenase [Gemmataceae bacterium]
MPPYRKLGSLPPKRHIVHRQEPGYRNEGIYYEEVITTAGFGRAYSVVYHLRPPTRVTRVEAAGEVPLDLVTQAELRHHHLRTGALKVGGDPITGRVPILANADVTLARCRPAQRQAELYRNATADEILFVHHGAGTLHSMFGPLPFRPFDYIVVPRCTTYRLEFDAGEQPDLLVIESAGDVVIPARYLNPDGQLRLGAPYYERDLHGPEQINAIDREQETTVLIRDGRRLTRYTMASHPFDVVGWDGMVY